MATQKTYNNVHGRDKSKKYVKTRAADSPGTDDREESGSAADDYAIVTNSYPERPTKDQVRGTHGRGHSRERRDVPGSDRGVDKRLGGASGSGADSGGSVPSPLSLGKDPSNVQAKLAPTPEQQIRALKDELKAVQDENKAISRHAHHIREEFNQAARYINYLQDRHEQHALRMRETIAGLENESSVLRQQLANAKNPANVGGKEALGSQAFHLTKTDTLSVSEVSKKLNNFNEEISQAAALLGKTIVPQEYPEDQKRPALASVGEMVGLNIISMLVSESRKTVPKVNPIFSQVVFRAFFVNFCTRLIEDWCPDDREKSRAFKAMYQDLRDTEEQTVFGPWRALTRSRTKVNPDLWQTDPLTSFDKLVFAGWKIPSDAERTNIEGTFKIVLKAAEQLRRALGACVVSMDLHVYGVSAGMQFQPNFVDDVYGDANTRPFKASRAEVVIGTVGFGLKKAIRERASSGQLQFINMISAKVALETTLREALKESPPPTCSDPDAASSGTVPTANPHPAIRTVGGVEQSAKYKIPQLDSGS